MPAGGTGSQEEKKTGRRKDTGRGISLKQYEEDSASVDLSGVLKVRSKGREKRGKKEG